MVHSLRDRLVVTLDACFIHRPQRGEVEGKKQQPFPLEDTIRSLQSLTRPLNGYMWSHDSPDALSFSAQLAVLLAHPCQRTPKQTIDARFGRLEEKLYQPRVPDHRKKNIFKRVPW